MFSSRVAISLLSAAWLSATVAGMTVLWNHEARPGMAAKAPERWPEGSLFENSSSQTTMLVWIHPHCPCSRATIRELERLLVHFPKKVDCRVVLTRPPNCNDDFVETELTNTVRKLSQVTVVVDDDQREARRFGVSTSGQVLIYDCNAQLLFAGGITPSRGHEGDSLGGATIRKILQGESAIDGFNGTCVYGCELFGEETDGGQSL